MEREQLKVYGNVFDEATLRNLFKLSSQGYFENLKSTVSTGKEANIFTAVKDNRLICVKIYRIQTADFNKMYDYLIEDPRFSNIRKNKRFVILTWAQKEYRNLLKIRPAQVSAPKPHVIKDNILVMDLIGDKEAAPKLKDARIKNYETFYENLIKELKKLYQKAELVHGDLSEFNILVYKDKPVIIDWSHALPVKSHAAKKYLERDINNIVRYFNKKGLNLNKDEVIKKICTDKS